MARSHSRRLTGRVLGAVLWSWFIPPGIRQATDIWWHWGYSINGDPNWFSVSAYRSLAVNAFASLQRGQRVIVTGRLKVRRWENGERSGIAVEIDADALGPDLLWGTASFQRLAGARDGQSGADTAGATDGEASEAAWHVPGAEEPASAPVSPAGLDGIASGHDAPQDAEWAGAVTPF
jgi:single-strand DNA-binding protein